MNELTLAGIQESTNVLFHKQYKEGILPDELLLHQWQWDLLLELFELEEEPKDFHFHTDFGALPVVIVPDDEETGLAWQRK